MKKLTTSTKSILLIIAVLLFQSQANAAFSIDTADIDTLKTTLATLATTLAAIAVGVMVYRVFMRNKPA